MNYRSAVNLIFSLICRLAVFYFLVTPRTAGGVCDSRKLSVTPSGAVFGVNAFHTDNVRAKRQMNK